MGFLIIFKDIIGSWDLGGWKLFIWYFIIQKTYMNYLTNFMLDIKVASSFSAILSTTLK